MELDQTSVRIIFQFADQWRSRFNRQLDHLEPWQVILYTLAVVLFVQWVKKVLKYEEFVSPQKWWREVRRLIPAHRHKLEESKEAAYKEIEDRLLRFDRTREFYKFLPDHGLGTDEIIQEATAYKGMGDVVFERGRMCGSAFAAVGDEEATTKLLKSMFELYGYTNASFPEVFPSCRKMEAEVIRILCSLYHGSVKSCGVLTTSGSESIILACLAHRNRAMRRGIRKPELIAGRNAHIAFSKAAKLLGMRLVRVSINGRQQLNVGAVKRAISRETCMIVASAPGFVTGVMDDVDEIAKLGQRFGVPVHVDATLGGFIVPFMEQCDYPAPPFDFRLPGVTSISVDLHKYGYCPTGSSAVLYRDPGLLHHHCYSNLNWPGGVYVSQTLSGSRSGLLIALTWATLLRNGRLGYVEKTQRILDAARKLRQKMADVEYVEVLGDPLGPVVAFTTTNRSLSPHKLGAEMNQLGWSIGFLQDPAALRLCISLNQTRDDVLDEFVDDLKKTCDKLFSITKVMDTIAAPIEAPARSIPIFGLSTLFEDHGVIDYLPFAFVDAYYATPNQPHGSTRTLSIEGRKLSQIHAPSGLSLLRQRQQSIDHSTGNLLPPPLE